VINSVSPPDRAPDPAAEFELIEHSGDVKVRVRGQKLEDVFVNAACGMMAFMFYRRACEEFDLSISRSPPLLPIGEKGWDGGRTPESHRRRDFGVAGAIVQTI
jgi:hypothetical protein